MTDETESYADDPVPGDTEEGTPTDVTDESAPDVDHIPTEDR